MKKVALFLLSLFLLTGCYTRYALVDTQTTVTKTYQDTQTGDTTQAVTTYSYDATPPYWYDYTVTPDFGWYGWGYYPGWYYPQIYYRYSGRTWEFYRPRYFSPGVEPRARAGIRTPLFGRSVPYSRLNGSRRGSSVYRSGPQGRSYGGSRSGSSGRGHR